MIPDGLALNVQALAPLLDAGTALAILDYALLMFPPDWEHGALLEDRCEELLIAFYNSTEKEAGV